MESQISHTLADLLSSRPKAYSLNTLEKLLHLRLLFKNKYNIKLLFLNNINKKEILTLNKEFLNLSLFNNNYTQLDESIIPTNYHSSHFYDSTFNLNYIDNYLNCKF